MFARIFDGDLTAHSGGCFSMDGRSRRTSTEREGKGEGEEAGIRDFGNGPTESAMRLVIHHGRPGAR